MQPFDSGLAKAQELSLAVAAQNVHDLVSYHVLNSLTSRLQVLARIEVIRMLSHVLTDGSSHSQTDIGVDVDLAYSQLSSLTQLIFRNTDSIRHLTAVGVYDLYELLRNGGRTVQNDREARQTLDALFQYVETQRRRNQNAVLVASALLRSELVCAVGSTDSDCQRVTTGAGNE